MKCAVAKFYEEKAKLFDKDVETVPMSEGTKAMMLRMAMLCRRAAREIQEG